MSESRLKTPSDLPPEAVAIYEQANSFIEANQAEKAEPMILGLCEKYPQISSVWGLLGVCYYDQLNFEKAYAAFRNIAEKAGNKQFYAFKTGFLDLLAGDYRHGWELYMQRRRQPLPLQLLSGKNFRSFKHLLVLREQGYGDIIQFVRFLHPLRNHFPDRKITFLCPPPMLRLMHNYAKDININLIHELDEENISKYGFDAYTHLCSLPIHLGMQKQHAGLIGNFFTFDKQKSAELRASLPKPAVGLCWAGRRGYPRFYNRDCDNKDVEFILESFPDFKFVSLMKPDVELPVKSKEICGHPRLNEEPIKDVKDFYDLATLISSLDFLITVDSAPLHVSATLGMPTYCLLGYAPDWRWMMGQTDSLWYPSCKLFREIRPGDWRTPVEDLIDQVKRDLPILTKTEKVQ